MKDAILTTLALLLLAGSSRAREDPPAAAGEAEVGQALARAFEWMGKRLSRLPEVSGTPQKPFTMAVAGLVHLMAEGRYGADAAVPARAKRYLAAYVDRVARRAADPAELPARHGRVSSDRLVQYTWPLAQAGVFFAECVARGKYREESRKALRTIVRLLSEAQQANGGWGHGRVRGGTTPEPEAGESGRMVLSGYPSTLLAASNCVATSLGIIESVLGRGSVPGLDRARAYYRAARLPDGGFPYDPRQRRAAGSPTNVSRTGGALLAQHFLGVGRADPELAGSLAYLLRDLEYASEGHGSATLNFAHTAFALRVLDPRGFRRFRGIFFPRILSRQDEEGAFDCACDHRAFATTCDSPREGVGTLFPESRKAYVTALHTFVLLLDGPRLRLLDRKVPPAPRRGETTPSKGRAR